MIELRFKNTYGSFTLDVEAQEPSGGVTAVFGPSGSGKTRLLRLMAGFDTAAKGEMKVDGEDWTRLKPHERSIGYVFQNAGLFAHLSVEANLKYGYKRAARGKKPYSFEEVVDWMALGSLLARSTEALSGGERQRVAVGRALLRYPKLLLLDEPFSALDAKSKRELGPYLERAVKSCGASVFLVSHSMSEVASLANRIILMARGRVTDAGALSALSSRLDSSLTAGEDAESIFEATALRREERFGLLVLSFEAGELFVPDRAMEIGERTRVSLLARDVSLTLERQTGTSILNVIPVVVDSMRRDGDAQVMVRLLAGRVPLLARVTRKSAEALGLSEGQALFAQVKSVAFLRTG